MSTQLPVLRQSLVELASCPKAYVAVVIDGKQSPESEPSERGSDLHHVSSLYVRHCAKNKVESDLVELEKLSAASGPVAGPILDRYWRETEVDWQNLYATEETLALDDEFGDLFEPSDGRAAYSGTLDTIYVYGNDHAVIKDYKSHPGVFEADTFQSKLYPFMLFKHMPKLKTITFELAFVRYTNCIRSVTYKRSDMPDLQAEIARARERQRLTHAAPDEAKPIAGKVCAYCPMGKNFTCPIADWNEYTVLSPQDRLNWRVWMSKMGDINNRVLKDYVIVNGPVQIKDGNGRVIQYGEEEVAETRYPLDATSIQLLVAHKEVTGEDLLDGRLNISSTKLKGFLKAKKRAPLLQAFEDTVIERSTKPKYIVRTPEGIETEFRPWDQE